MKLAKSTSLPIYLIFLIILGSQASAGWVKMRKMKNPMKPLTLLYTALLYMLMRKNSPSTAGHLSPQLLKEKKQKEASSCASKEEYRVLTFSKSSDTSDVEASENESVKISAKKPGRKLKPISDESESTEESDVRRKVKPADNISTQREAVSATASSEPSEKPAESVTLKKKTQKKKMFRGKRKKPRSEATDLDTSDCLPIWCLKEKKTSDIMELDVVLSAFENILLEYKQKTDSKICKEAINKFHSNLKEELIKMLKEVQMLKTLKRKNTKMISDIEKKRQRLIEVQDELLRLEPELKQLQIKYDELKERKASLRNAANFLSNLKQLHQDYSDIQEKEPNVKETYDSSSLPALLFKARPLLGAENHLQNINYQLEKLLDQK
ncbi:centromere protein U isoform X3 [Balaenoptera musculus]|uniref:Centromere protein U n=1 Tax=Balaenoptera musculus TaxID=9771 RepID=A0A8B8WBK4_BALMU|nr:centromere protein U isoform X3 [Balaenoptera musculus]XP_036694520.1 centromere protein U isoform X3 [Balaenoptera musculus]XP_036694521.1 centromere protein U isoform X3 [Balaenoptera musculus]